MDEMISKSKKQSNEIGATLIELLAVIVILGIIASVAVLVIGDVIQTARKQAFVSNAYIMRNASTVFYKNKEFNKEPLINPVTYNELVTSGFLDVIIDPDTGDEWGLDQSESYVVFKDGKAVSICLIGMKRKLCGEKQAEGYVPLPIDQIREENVKDRDT